MHGTPEPSCLAQGLEWHLCLYLRCLCWVVDIVIVIYNSKQENLFMYMLKFASILRAGHELQNTPCIALLLPAQARTLVLQGRHPRRRHRRRMPRPLTPNHCWSLFRQTMKQNRFTRGIFGHHLLFARPRKSKGHNFTAENKQTSTIPWFDSFVVPELYEINPHR
jgi:hypothetical protein